MVTITNNSMTLKVSKGAYLNYFKRRGFHVVNGAEINEEDEVYPTPPENGTSQETDEDDEDDEEDDEEDEEEDEEEPALDEIPLSDMNKEQLCDYAERLGLDPGDLTKKELRELIREHLEK